MTLLSMYKKQIGIITAAIVIIFSGIWFLGVKTPAYAVIVNGQQRFIVKDQDTVKQALNKILAQKQKDYHNKLEISSKISFDRTFASRDQLLAPELVYDKINQELQYKTGAVAIVVNGKPVAYVENDKIAQAILTQLKKDNSRPEEGEKVLSVAFEEKVTTQKAEVALAQLMSQQGAWDLITTGTKNPERYKIQEGDNLWTIARKNDMYVSDIVKANHLNENDILALGQEIVLIKSKPYINVIAKLEGKRTETIPYQTKVVTDKKAGYSVKVKTEGKNGQKTIAYQLVLRNGAEQKRDILEEKIIQPVVDRVLVKGSSVARISGAMQVASRGSGGGSLDWPLYGSITQPFGGGHTGVDIAGSTGTAVKAAAGGTVILAGYQGGYGKLVIIDHGDGLVTRYAHLNSISVSEGQQVSRGAAIGTRGSTGHSTGPHLHFEVLQNGSFRNPMSYLR